MKIDICYIISHGFAQRMLLQTNLIGLLVEEGVNVGIITPDIKDQNLEVFREHDQVKLIEWKSRNSLWDDNYMHKRMYFLEDVNQNPALKEKFYNGIFFSTSKHPWKRIRPLWYYLIYKLIPFFPSIRSRFISNESAYLKSEEADQILEDIRPGLLVSTYPVNIMEAKLLHAAKQKGMTTVLQLLSWDNISSKGKFPVLTDYYIVWGQIMHDELRSYYGISDAKIECCGVPHFDEHIKVKNEDQSTFLKTELGFEDRTQFLFFAMSSPRFAPKEIDIVERLSKLIESDVFGEHMNLVVRPHPQNVQSFTAKSSWLTRLEKLRSDRVHIDYPSLNTGKLRWSLKQNDMNRLAKLLSSCSLCLNSGSTITIEALLMDKPVVLTAFDDNASLPYWNSARRLIDYTHQKKLIELGGINVVRDLEALAPTIKQSLETAAENSKIRKSTFLKQCYSDDGQSTQRVKNALMKQLNLVEDGNKV